MSSEPMQFEITTGRFPPQLRQEILALYPQLIFLDEAYVNHEVIGSVWKHERHGSWQWRIHQPEPLTTTLADLRCETVDSTTVAVFFVYQCEGTGRYMGSWHKRLGSRFALAQTAEDPDITSLEEEDTGEGEFKIEDIRWVVTVRYVHPKDPCGVRRLEIRMYEDRGQLCRWRDDAIEAARRITRGS